MKKTKQINFRLSEEEISEFKAAALSHGLEPSEYFRRCCLSPDGGLIATESMSSKELAERAKAAQKLIHLRELERNPAPAILKSLHQTNLIYIFVAKIANQTMNFTGQENQTDQVEKILKTLKHITNLQRMIQNGINQSCRT